VYVGSCWVGSWGEQNGYESCNSELFCALVSLEAVMTVETLMKVMAQVSVFLDLVC
jgi:hypothetical protein